MKMAEFLPTFSDQKVSLKKCKQFGVVTPSIVKIVEKSDGLHLPRKLMEEQLLLHSVVNHRKVICQCVDLVSKDGQIYFSSQRFSIPLGYPGWFEILSEDGKTVTPCKTIEEVFEKNPDKFLVRSKVKAYLSEENGDPDYDKTRIVQKGEVLTVVGQFTITHGWRKQKKRILHCLDNNGVDIYLDFKSTGQFSAMAGPANISGVHSIEGLVGQFRLPLTVRIVSGQIPRVASENERPGVFRLIEVQMDTTALFLPIKSYQKLLPVSTRTDLNILPCSNMLQIRKTPYYTQVENLAQQKVDKYFKTMQVLVSTKPANKVFSACTLPSRKKSGHLSQSSGKPGVTEEDILFAEVDDLYAYVRRGGVPPKPRPRSWANNLLDPTIDMNTDGKSSSQPMLSSNGKPRGLLATLTAGKFPSKTSSTLLRQSKLACSSGQLDQHPSRTSVAEMSDIPVSKRHEIIRSFIEKYRGSEESLLTDVDPYVDEGHYQNFETIEQVKRIKGHTRQYSLDNILTPKPPRPRLSSIPTDLENMGFNEKLSSSQRIITFIERTAANYQQQQFIQAT